MFICFAGHGVVNEKKKRIKVNGIKKNGFFIIPPLILKYYITLTCKP